MLSLRRLKKPGPNSVGPPSARTDLLDRMKGAICAAGALLALVAEPTAAAGPYLTGQDCVVLVHGLARGTGSFWLVEKTLTRKGYYVVNADYPSTTARIAELVEHLGAAVERCGSRPVHFVTHSLGGILVRYLLAYHSRPQLGRIVMLGSPNHGSEIVDLFGDLPPFEWINGPAGQELGTGADAIPNLLPRPDYPIGIIAGDISVNPIFNAMLPGPNDGKVTIESTKLEGAADHLVVHATHTFMMYNPIVVIEMLNFLENGAFQHGLSFSVASRQLAAAFE
ncbi:esterase/lipase family protein [Neorhizobium sp. DT-125]|uniref:esterase/lipase family protein n=1 Tax=Neorhizobium sp. DT-125 TaxID=3396163 RepID=UPI003F1BE252